MIIQISTEKQFIEILNGLQNEIGKLQSQGRVSELKMQCMQAEIDKKPNVQIKETIIKTDPAVMPTLKKVSGRLLALESVKPKVKIKETVIKEIEKPTIIEKTVIQTDPSVMPTLKKLSDRLSKLENAKPIIQIKESIVKEVLTPTVLEKTIIQTDASVLPTIKKIAARLKLLEDSKPETQTIKEYTAKEIKIATAASKKEIDEIKNTILQIMPALNKLKSGVTSDDVLKLINKHVILSFINKLYGN